MNLVKELNEEQREAVVNTEGPALTLAGPGSGKTRVLTYRAAYLVENIGIHPKRILAVTFTNKAAREMQERIHGLLPDIKETPILSTFHSFCLRVLREIGNTGLSSVKRNFVIYDDQDSTRLLKSILKDMDKDPSIFKPAAIASRISMEKNMLRTPEEFSEGDDSYMDEEFIKIYTAYQEELEKAGGLDFDDLIMKTVLTFKTFPQILSRYSNHFKYVMVDEFQDTNYAQYILMKTLCRENRNLFVVGDEDQSIYSWRGANRDNLELYEKDFPEYRLFKLETNYRSTKNIVKVSSQIINENIERKQKEHRTDNPEGENVIYYRATGDKEEAFFVTETIKKLKTAFDVSNIAILYRTNWQSRVFEEQLLKANESYIIVGGVKFYQRKEIKDVIAYYRLVLNIDDTVALERIINTPKRGIGDKTVETIKKQADALGVTAGSFIINNLDDLDIAKGSLVKIKIFKSLIQELQTTAKTSTPADLLKSIILKSGYDRFVTAEDNSTSGNRLENLDELLKSAAVFTRETENPTIESYLDHLSLLTDLDEYKPDNKISLMTIHNSKGLEFDVVFLVGLEENLLPHQLSMEDPRQLEEERRLCFVAMTRAAKMLYLTNSQSRFTVDGVINNEPSRFLSAIEPGLLIRAGVENTQSYTGAIKGTSPLKVGNNLDNIKQFFKEKNIDLGFLDKQRNPSSSAIKLKMGQRVRHPKFGIGNVYGIEGSGKAQKAKILFQSHGFKTLILEYADLEIID